MGTKIPLNLSAKEAMGAFVLVASITRRTISEMVEDAPIFFAS